MPAQPGQRRATSAEQAGEEPFWRLAGASWRRLAGGFNQVGFSFEWHDWLGNEPLDWAGSFHSDSVEICLNLQGTGTVISDGAKMILGPESTGFFVSNGSSLSAERSSGCRHQFLTVEFYIPFLRERLAGHREQLHPVIARCVNGEKPCSGLSGVGPLTNRHRDLLKSLLHPPVLASAQRLWFELKALEFTTEFFFRAASGETLCSRAQRVARERVSRAKEILLANMANPPSLEELGKQIGCSHFYLSRTFTKEAGESISQWLRRARLEKAGELLRTGRCNVTEAALEVGYSSLSHFSEAFHQMYGCCPGLYPLRTRTQVQGSPDVEAC